MPAAVVQDRPDQTVRTAPKNRSIWNTGLPLLRPLHSDSGRKIILGLWIITLITVIMPWGPLAAGWRFVRHLDQLLKASPYGRLCDACASPATTRTVQGDRVIYFCSKQHVFGKPVRFFWRREYDPPRAGIWVWMVGLLSLCGSNLYRAAVHYHSQGDEYSPTLAGVLGTWFLIAILWEWFVRLMDDPLARIA